MKDFFHCSVLHSMDISGLFELARNKFWSHVPKYIDEFVINHLKCIILMFNNMISACLSTVFFLLRLDLAWLTDLRASGHWDMDEQRSTKTGRFIRSFVPGRQTETPRDCIPAPVWGRRSWLPPERGVPPHYCVLVWRHSLCPAWGPQAGPSGYDLREKSRRLVWSWSSGTYTQVGVTALGV